MVLLVLLVYKYKSMVSKVIVHGRTHANIHTNMHVSPVQ